MQSAYGVAATAAAAGPAGRKAGIDRALVAVAKAARELANVLTALDVVPCLREQVGREDRYVQTAHFRQ